LGEQDLRKTYISRHRAESGDLGLTATMSDHSNTNEVDKNYNAWMDFPYLASFLAQLGSTTKAR